MKLSNKEMQEKLSKVERGQVATENEVDGVKARLGDLSELCARHCNHCKHKTMQQKSVPPSSLVAYFASLTSGGDYYTIIPERILYLCLNCGKEWECEEKTVCTEIKDKK